MRVNPGRLSRLGVVASTLLLPRIAHATPCDVDGDGYQHSGGTCTPGAAVDCNDSLIGGAAINPNAVEIGDDGIDQDCDTHDGIAQR